MKAPLRRKIWITGGFLLLALAIWFGFLPRAREVELVRVARAPLQVTIEEEGKTRLKQRFVIYAPVAGYLRRLAVKVGDAVAKGQAVAVLEPLRSQALDPRSRDQAAAVVAAAEASLAAALEQQRAAESEADYAHKRFERIAQLSARQTVAKDQLDQTASEAKKAQAFALSAAAAVKTARWEVERAKSSLRLFPPEGQSDANGTALVTAPVSGCVFKLFRESEGAVQAGEPLLEIGDVADLEVMVEVLSADAVKIRPGMAVVFKRWGRDEPLQGKVRRVEPAGFTKVSSLGVEEQRVLALVDITSPPELWQALGDGYRLEAHFVIWQDENVLQVPASALFRTGNQWAVFVEEQGRAHRRNVSIGRQTGLAAQILDGVKEGEKVVAYPDDAVGEGTRIRQRL